MISITLNGSPAWFCPYLPDLASGVMLRLRAKLHEDMGATGRSARPQASPVLDAEQEWELDLSGAERTALANALSIYQAEPIVVPCWMLMQPGSAYTASHGGLMVAWNESGGQWIGSGTVASPANWDWIAPAIVGFFAERPQPSAMGTDRARYSLRFTEDAPAAWALGPFGTAPSAAGPALGGFSPPGCPFELDWINEPESGAAEILVTRTEIGDARQRLQTFFPNDPERIVSGGVTLADPLPLLAWWRAVHGGAESQWASTWAEIGRLAADAAAGATSIVLQAAPSLGLTSVLAIHGPSAIAYVAVTSVAGATVNVSALPFAITAESTVVCAAMLARHTAEQLEITWNGDHCSAPLDWRELRAEATLPAGEVRGTTIGRKPGRAYLVEISSEEPVAEVLDRCTGWPADLTLGDGRSFTARPVEIGERQQSIDLADHSLDLTLPYFAGSPLSNFLPGLSRRRLFLTLSRCAVAADGSPGAAVVEWYGVIEEAQNVAQKFQVRVGSPFAVFEQQVPADQFGLTCNAHWGDARCGVNPANWLVSATVVSASGVTLVVGSATRPGGAMTPLQAANALAEGRLEWTEAGKTRICGIYASSYAAGAYTLTLGDPVGLSAGVAVTIVPGCDLLFASGCTRYTGKFRGFHKIPARAPQFKIPDSATTAGKK